MILTHHFFPRIGRVILDAATRADPGVTSEGGCKIVTRMPAEPMPLADFCVVGGRVTATIGGMATKSTGVGRGSSATPIERKRLKGSRIRTGLAASPMPETALALVDMSVVPVVPKGLGKIGEQYWTVLWTGGRRHLSELHDGPLMGRLCRNY